jgi:hypothetical protein
VRWVTFGVASGLLDVRVAPNEESTIENNILAFARLSKISGDDSYLTRGSQYQQRAGHN